MVTALCSIGFGEAAAAFADGPARGYDRKLGTAATRAAKLADFAAAGVDAAPSNGAAIGGAATILPLVTPDQALAAAAATAAAIAQGALSCDVNSVAPQTKRSAATAIERVGGRYLDVAVMAPAHPQRRAVPLLVSGPHADAGAAMLRGIGFADVCVVGTAVGAASTVKMARSVMIKGSRR